MDVQGDADGQPERWALDDFLVRDVSALLWAREQVEAQLVRFPPQLAALGFVELGIDHTGMDPGVDGQIRENHEMASSMIPDDAADSPFAEQVEAWRVQQQEMAEGSLSWLWVHPETHDLATVEHARGAEWISLRRYHDDGSLVRSLRRPEGVERLPSGVAAVFLGARLPLLFHAVSWLAGDTFALNFSPRTGLGEHNQVVDVDDAGELWQAHRAWATARLGEGAVAVPMDLELALALGRRTLHTASTCADAMGATTGRDLLVGHALVYAAVVGVLWAGGLHVAVAAVVGLPATFLGMAVLAWAGGLWSSITLGGAFLANLLLARQLDAGLLVLAAAGVALVGSCAVVARAIHRSDGPGRLTIVAALTEPRQLPPDELRVRYRG
ncbi:MAG: hypothetical protein H6732_15180 [Alphaproteobacteria bacterium]|nr:hypothetical protein [Alphaproteobacteria bacterium]